MHAEREEEKIHRTAASDAPQGGQAAHSNAALSDEDLLRATSIALGLAHRAPMAEWAEDHKGDRAIVNHTNGWARHSNAFSLLYAELKRRGLKLPKCDCSPCVPPGDAYGALMASNERKTKTDVGVTEDRPGATEAR